ncbi:hypothetical protein CLV91_0160 [Maribacter vaceletii]|uniref:Tetratricopeptide repeat protein n=1 Tax=Maribacter vaceletii TaxID=1206816 RepID=A0A495EBU9_9FLAO|nr:hypothetical protein [Maribacter vaceletii]RKR14089.1 hypothetical protein CLV91_0160 [Maribacter vaceletii]
MITFIKPKVYASISDTIPPINTTIQQSKKFIQEGYSIAHENQEKAYQHFLNGATYYKLKKDTTAYINCMLGLSEIKIRQGKFNRSFEILWDIFPKAKQNSNKNSLALLHRKLGSLYGLYGKDSLSLYHLKKSVEIVKKNNAPENLLPSSYLPLAIQCINTKKYDTALKYLDSCYLSNKKKNRLIYIDAYYGHIHTKKKDYRKANIYLKGLTSKFKERKLGFLAMVCSFNGDLKLSLKETDSAIYYYKKSLEVINTMKVHIEQKTEVLEQLATLHFKINKKAQAFNYMKSAKAISDSLFHTQSEHNKELFEIKNKYQEDLSKKEAKIIAQNKLIELKDIASFRQKLLISLLILLAAIGILTFRQRYRIKKMLYNKEKNDAILEIRNKELTANALQIIEKDHTVNELLETIKENIPQKYKSLNNKYKQSNEKLWNDFHLQFTKTNSEFYKRLLEIHSKLTPNDLKCCALIKLKFDSKEMSQILGISLHSVHMARSRVRKKLNLSREENLSNYIAMI